MGHKDLDKINAHTAKDHKEWYAEFCEKELMCGGPDSHLTTSGYMATDYSANLEEIIWMGGCYVAGYCAPTASVLWYTFSRDDVLQTSEETIANWFTEHREGLYIHRHRKCVYRAQCFAEYIRHYAEWCKDFHLSRFFDPSYKNAETRYKELWDEATKAVKFLGRYSCFKLLEFFKLFAGLPIVTPDIRPRDGWSPRQMLSMMWPERRHALLGDDTPENIEVVNQTADELFSFVRDDKGIDLDMFHIQVFLCEYKQCYFNQKQYPGKGHDSELEYAYRIAGHWGEFDEAFAASRKKHFPHWALGELQGWEGKRWELGETLYNHGYMWSDGLYDYGAMDSIANPVRRN